jgi:hypothetical protein
MTSWNISFSLPNGQRLNSIVSWECVTDNSGLCGTVYFLSCSDSQKRIMLEDINQRQCAYTELVWYIRVVGLKLTADIVTMTRLLGTGSVVVLIILYVRSWVRCLARKEDSRLRMFETRELRISSGTNIELNLKTYGRKNQDILNEKRSY